MKKIIFATGNEGKMNEIRVILKELGCDIVSLKEAGIDVHIEEDGKTFEENAIIKAKTIMNLTKKIVLADDSGLEVDYLSKAPGVYSARYLGEDTPYTVKNQSILDQLAEAVGEERSARFVCVVACAFPDGTVLTTRGTMEGQIGYEERGSNGFGYDPIFFVPEYGCTTGEMEMETKNKISHRGAALRAMKEILKKDDRLS